jgi:hypothetical protein
MFALVSYMKILIVWKFPVYPDSILKGFSSAIIAHGPAWLNKLFSLYQNKRQQLINNNTYHATVMGV